MRYVVDASVAVRWYLIDEASPNADAVLERLLAEPGLFAAPELFFFEVLAVLARTHPDYGRVYDETFLPATGTEGSNTTLPPLLAWEADIAYTACAARAIRPSKQTGPESPG